jgi:hypothetical protein
MEMHRIEPVNFGSKRTPQSRRPVDPSERRRTKIPDSYGIQSYLDSDRHVAISGPVHVGGKNFDFMASRHQSLAEPVDGENRATISHSRQIARNDVQNSHH